MGIPEILEKTGLNQKEAMVYMALLELGTSSVEGIAKKAGTKRPTTYLILDELQKKGLATLIPRAKKVLYMPESPDKIVSDLNRKQELMKRFLPNLLAVYNEPKNKPQVLLYEGKEAVREVYDKILSAKEVKFFCTVKDIIETYPDFPKLLQTKTLEKKATVKELLTQTPEDIAFAKSIRHLENYQARFSPAGKNFQTDNALFDDKVVFFSYDPYIFAVMIQSKVIHQSLQTLFELAWTQSEPYEKIVKS
ncbi:MAG: helix-turn-helix domain-containing protein [Candidatus Doudnabacteria bacterium]